MALTVEVLLPWRRDVSDRGEYRLKAWRRTRAWWDEHFPSWTKTYCDDRGKPFSRGCSINAGASGGRSDVLLIVDADVVPQPGQVTAAVEGAIETGTMVFTFDDYRLLTQWETDEIHRGWTLTADWGTPASWQCVSASFAITREAFHEAGGFDPRFRGWGFEDNAFLDAVDTMCGPNRRVPGPIHHLWHPKDTVRPMANIRLRHQYEIARGDRLRMRNLIGNR